MEHVNYEEVYPTHISHLPPPDYSKQSPEVVTSEHDAAQLPIPVTNAGYDDLPASKEAPMTMAAAAPRRVCGLPRKMFWMVLLAIVVVAAVVGGAVGGSQAAKTHSKSVVDTSSASSSSVAASATAAGTATTSIASSQATATSSTTGSIGAIAASTFEDSSSSPYIHLYYQLSNTSQIFYRVYTGVTSGSSGWGPATELSLDIAPKDDTPLAAAAYTDGSSSYLYLYYLDSSNNIIEAYLSGNLSSTELTLNQTTTISASVTTAPHASTGLAAVYIGAYGWRVYYQNTDGYISELAKGTSWNKGKVVGGLAYSGSPIAASFITIPQINLFYVEAVAAELYTLRYTGSWSTASALTKSDVSTWNGTSVSLASAGQNTTDLMRTYYIGNNNGIYEYYNTSATAWKTTPDQSADWKSADSSAGGLAAVGWTANIRLYYAVSNQIVEAALTKTSWREGAIS
ncbi:hypothetical protein BP6252_05862 [Coleophoma cylindrospora]|uniref:Fucose-specific lectin n=1 Tax=Coleophoma cylindrospora TaxID=1849047 RepID=A0A3D8RUR0_9HELO|nr:hypothetical protein BP6252_05862 [Coleophoma cylindrospora]